MQKQSRGGWLSVLIVAILFQGVTAQSVRAGGGTDALLLSCMDYRLIGKTHAFLDGIGLHGRYDHVILAGASLGATAEQFPAWQTTFMEHLDIAIQLHGIHKVVLLDHRDCGAYKVVYNEDFSVNPEREFEIHRNHLAELKERIGEKYPELEVKMLLIDLDGAVEEIALAHSSTVDE
ncbi:MAG TPA: hypothetical protein PJ991_04235 [Kiritimatiellia bacterium]|nr:hypothetical protein [Kiritimatiellia bacterium]